MQLKKGLIMPVIRTDTHANNIDKTLKSYYELKAKIEKAMTIFSEGDIYYQAMQGTLKTLQTYEVELNQIKQESDVFKDKRKPNTAEMYQYFILCVLINDYDHYFKEITAEYKFLQTESLSAADLSVKRFPAQEYNKSRDDFTKQANQAVEIYVNYQTAYKNLQEEINRIKIEFDNLTQKQKKSINKGKDKIAFIRSKTVFENKNAAADAQLAKLPSSALLPMLMEAAKSLSELSNAFHSLQT